MLLGERSNLKNVWQFPQGGVDEGETALEAIKREMFEEVGQDQFEVINQVDGGLFYDFPEGFTAPIAQQYKGQVQTWFHLRFKEGFKADLSRAPHDEFRALRWASVEEVMDGVVEWKKEVYEKALKKLGLLS